MWSLKLLLFCHVLFNKTYLTLKERGYFTKEKDFLGLPRLLGTLHAVRHRISRTKTFANRFLTTF